VDVPAAGLLLRVEEAGELLGCGRTLIYAPMRTGQIRSVLVGRLRRIRREDLEAYTAGLPAASIERPSGNAVI
jgi:excisionase family DNA binding protein